MNTSDNDPFAFDERLRAHYDEAARTPPPPPARVWAALEPQLPPATATRTPIPRRAPLLAGIGGLTLGVLLMLLGGWWQPERARIRESVPKTPPGMVSAPVLMSPTRALASSTLALATPTRALAPSTRALAAPTLALAPSTLALASSTPALAPPTLVVIAPPPTPTLTAASELLPQIPAILLPLVQVETTLAGLGTDTARVTRESRRVALLAERAALAALTRRTDSLLRALDGAALALSPTAPADSVAPVALRNRWSVALAFAPERNFFGLAAPAADTLSALRRTHEQGRGGYNAAVLAEYRLDHRLSVGAGLGVASYGAELRLTEHRTSVSTRLDSSTNTTTAANTVITDAYIVRRVRDSVLVPILDFNNVVIGYQYLPTTRPDTVWTHLTNTQITNHTTTTYTPTVTTRQETSARILRPNYRFLTVPLLVRYRLGRAQDWTSSPTAPRWWADVAVGAQMQWFLGGTQASTRDGLTYHTETVGPRGGPFRPFNLALTGAVAFNYALTPRLSASLAPTLRYQVESVYRASTNLTQRPTATGVQMGLKYAF